MPLNLELKTKLKSHNRIKLILNNIGAENKGILNQKDIYYNVADGLLKLRIEDECETLIYYNRDENGKDRWSDYHLLKISDGKSENFLKRLFKVEVIVQKRRELYLYDNTRIHLDTVKSLGKYLELETLVIKGTADAQKRFKRIMKLLELEGTVEIRKSYRDILLGKMNKK